MGLINALIDKIVECKNKLKKKKTNIKKMNK